MSEDVVLTAAHCFRSTDAEHYVVFLGRQGRDSVRSHYQKVTWSG